MCASKFCLPSWSYFWGQSTFAYKYFLGASVLNKRSKEFCDNMELMFWFTAPTPEVALRILDNNKIRSQIFTFSS